MRYLAVKNSKASYAINASVSERDCKSEAGFALCLFQVLKVVSSYSTIFVSLSYLRLRNQHKQKKKKRWSCLSAVSNLGGNQLHFKITFIFKPPSIEYVLPAQQLKELSKL